MTNLSETYSEFRLATRSYTPMIPLAESDYIMIFKMGIKRLWVDTGRAEEYRSNALDTETFDYDADIGIDEMQYIYLAACIAFYSQMLTDASAPNRITQHKTDALTVTFSDKGYANLSGTIQEMEKQLSGVYFKLPYGMEALS